MLMRGGKSVGLTEGLGIPGNQQRQQAKGWQVARLPVLSCDISPTSLGTSAMFRTTLGRDCSSERPLLSNIRDSHGKLLFS